MSVLLNCLKPPGKIVTGVLNTQFSTCYELWFVWCTFKLVELLIALASVLLNCFKPPRKNVCNLIVGVLLNQWSCQLPLPVYC